MFGAFDYVLLIILFLAAVGMTVCYKIYIKLTIREIRTRIKNEKESLERKINHGISESPNYDQGKVDGLTIAEKIISEALR